MQIGIIRVGTLVSARGTLSLWWRIPICVTFLAVTWFWFWAICTIATKSLDTSPVSLGVIVPLVLVTAVLVIAICRRDAYSRGVLATAAVMLGLHLVIFAPFTLHAGLQPTNDADRALALPGVLLSLVLGWSLLRTGTALLLTLFPFRYFKPYYIQFRHSEQLWLGGRGTRHVDLMEGAKSSSFYVSNSASALRRSMVLFGTLAWALSFVGIMRLDFIPALFRGDVSRVGVILTRLLKDEPGNWNSEIRGSLLPILIGMLGYVLFFGFRILSERKTRALTRVELDPLSKNITSSDILFLRSFKDDVKAIAPESSLRNLLGTRLTLEVLIVRRLEAIGRVFALGSEHPNHPPLGATRHTPEYGWKREVQVCMPIARLIVIMVGSTAGVKAEMQLVKKRGHLGKCIFVMPPAAPWSCRRRWKQFVEYLTCDSEIRKLLAKRVKPDKVLAACLRDGNLLILTGDFAQETYESAVDLGTVIAVGELNTWDEMVTKHFCPVSRPVLQNKSR